MTFPQIQIQQTPARLDIQSKPGQFEIHQQKASMDIETTSAVLDIQTEQPVVIVDMSKTWDAITGGNPLRLMGRIYNQFGQFVQQAIENTVDEYNQIGDLRNTEDPIPEIARQSMYAKPPKVQIYGDASISNISYDVQLSKPEVDFKPGKVDVNISPNKPDIEFHRGNVNIQMAQYPSVKITPPQIVTTR